MTPSPLLRAIRAYHRLNQDHFLTKRAHRQRQLGRFIHLNDSQLSRLVERYQAGATVYELAPEFGIDRRSGATQLKRQGVKLRLQSPTPDQTDQMARLYRSGLSLVKVGERVGFDARTVQRSLWSRGLRLRDTHGRERS